jgi:parallel beta-helix repeat protein
VNKTRTAALLAAGTAIAIAPMLASGPAQAHAGSTTLYVSTHARAHASDHSCNDAGYRSIGSAVTAAHTGDTVVVCGGTFHEGVSVTKSLTISGRSGATIDASRRNTGVTIKAADVTVSGLTVRNAIGEGVLVDGVDHATITHNVVVHNDLGGLPHNAVPNTYPECTEIEGVPGDCGEGIHLMGSSHSTVAFNVSHDNSGGILLSDEGRPTAYNKVIGNTVSDNQFDCGITVVGHNPAAAPGGKPAPTVAGVHDNDIAGNRITGNGLKGEGAGVVLATPMPGGAVYHNLVRNNSISRNGMAGVSVHNHVKGQDLNDNVVRDNTIGTNNLVGDDAFKPAVDHQTTGVLVGAVDPLSITVVGNRITDDHFGIWTTGPVTVHGAKANHFVKVAVPVSSH